MWSKFVMYHGGHHLDPLCWVSQLIQYVSVAYVCYELILLFPLVLPIVFELYEKFLTLNVMHDSLAIHIWKKDQNWYLCDFIISSYCRIAKALGNCNATTGDIISTTERLKQELENTTQRQEIASCFLRDYQLSNDEVLSESYLF